MIEIKVTDADAPTLRKLAAALMVLSGDVVTTTTVQYGPAPHETTTPLDNFATTPARAFFPPIDTTLGERAAGLSPAASAPYAAGVTGSTIAPNDVPSVGAEAAFDPVETPEPDVVDPVVAFADPAAVFGAGNGAAGLGSASSPSHVSTDAPSTATPITYAVAPTGEQGNVGLTPPQPGTPPVSANTSQTAGASIGAVDKSGLPWDVRIHAGTKTKKADGTWKKKPNVDAAVVAQVEAELRATMALPGAAPNVAAVPAGVPATPPANVPVPPPASAPGNVPLPPAAILTPPALAATTTATGAPKITGFAQLLPAVTAAVASGALAEAAVTAALARVGAQALPQIAPRTDLVLQVAAELFPDRV